MSYFSSMPTVSYGDSGNDVTTLQTALTSAGYSTKGIDGIFGDNTKDALHLFQSTKGLPQTDYAGDAVWSALSTQSSNSTTSSSSDSFVKGLVIAVIGGLTVKYLYDHFIQK